MIPQLIYPLFFFGLYFLPMAVFLAFVPRGFFNSWLKLAVWLVPLLAVFIAITPVNFTGLGIDFLPFYRDDAARLAGGVLTGASFILVLWKFIASRRPIAN